MSNNHSIFINGVYQDPKALSIGIQTMPQYKNVSSSPGLIAQPIASITQSQVAALSNLTSSSFSYNTASLDLSEYNRNPDVKKYEVYESPEDVIVLSATWKRMRDEGKFGRVAKLMDAALFKEITSVDRQKASVIRDFYSKKIMMWNLKGNLMTEYRKDLNKLIQSDGTLFKENMLGLAYHLPTFYEYDMEMEEVRLSTDNKHLKRILGVQMHELAPIKKLHKKTRTSNMNEYWFKNTTSNTPVLISIGVKNPLENIWNHMFSNQKVLQIQGTFIHKKHDDFEYFCIGDKWEVVHNKI
jgi:hypothetical protein